MPRVDDPLRAARRAAARLTIDATPRADSTVTQENERLTIKFDADALDVALAAARAAPGTRPRRAPGRSGHAGGRSRAALRRLPRLDASRSTTRSRLVIDMLAAQTEPAATSLGGGACRRRHRSCRCGRPAGSPRSGRSRSIPATAATTRARAGAGGTKEKDLTLGVARRLKASIEGAARHPRAPHARRRPERAARRSRPRSPTTTRPICSSACTPTRRVRPAQPARRSSTRRSTRDAAARRVRSLGPSACRPSAAARATSSSSCGISRRSGTLDQSVALATILEQQFRDRVPLAPHADRSRAACACSSRPTCRRCSIEMGYLTNAGSGEAAREHRASRTRFVQAHLRRDR